MTRDLDTVQDRLHSIALPCVTIGLVTLVLSSSFYLVQGSRAQDFDRLAVDLAGLLAAGTAFWLLPHLAALWWVRRGGRVLLEAFFVAGVLAGGGVAWLLWRATEHGLGALVGLVLGSWFFGVEVVALVSRAARRRSTVH